MNGPARRQRGTKPDPQDAELTQVRQNKELPKRRLEQSDAIVDT